MLFHTLGKSGVLHSQEVVWGPSHCSTYDALHLYTLFVHLWRRYRPILPQTPHCAAVTFFVRRYTIYTRCRQSCNVCISCFLKLFLATGFSAFHISPAHFTCLTNDTQTLHEIKVLLEDVMRTSRQNSWSREPEQRSLFSQSLQQLSALLLYKMFRRTSGWLAWMHLKVRNIWWNF